MAEKNNIELTDNSITNIRNMLSMLNDEQRKAMSHVMFGFVIGKEWADSNRTATTQGGGEQKR